MRAEPARPFSLGFDTVAPLTAAHCAALRTAGMTFAIRYLGSVTPEELRTILAAGLAFMPVTYAHAYDGARALGSLRALGLPAGATVWLDVEGCTEDAAALTAKINAWARPVRAGRYDPGMYVGARSLLTSAELFALAVDRYWHACSRLTDRHGAPQAPERGFCMRQLRPYNAKLGGTTVDVDVIEADYHACVPAWVVA